MKRLMFWGLAIGFGVLVAKQLPDLQRYLKIRAM